MRAFSVSRCRQLAWSHHDWETGSVGKSGSDVVFVAWGGGGGVGEPGGVAGSVSRNVLGAPTRRGGSIAA